MSFQNEKSSTQESSLQECEVVVISNQRQPEDSFDSIPAQQVQNNDGGMTPPPSCTSCGDAPRD